MRKILAALILMVIFSAVNAQGLTVHLEGGKIDKFTNEVTYKTVIEEYDSYRRLTSLFCKGKGGNTCSTTWQSPRNISTFEKTILDATVYMEFQILEDLKAGKTSGEYKYEYLTLLYKNAELVTDDSGKEKLLYDWSIIDFQTERNVEDIKKYKESLDKQSK